MGFLPAFPIIFKLTLFLKCMKTYIAWIKSLRSGLLFPQFINC